MLTGNFYYHRCQRITRKKSWVPFYSIYKVITKFSSPSVDLLLLPHYCFQTHKMARKAKAISTTTSTNSIMPSDNLDPAATAPLALSQEASTPVQATASNITKKKKTSKKRSTAGPVTTTPSDPNNATALLARVAEQQGKYKNRRHCINWPQLLFSGDRQTEEGHAINGASHQAERNPTPPWNHQ